MSSKVFNILFVCTGNSARSILAEGLMTYFGDGHFKAFSAGSHPMGTVNPFAISTLRQLRVPKLDFVLTVCDNAAGEVCPVWPGQPMTAHWGVPDPAAVPGTDEQKAKAFMDTAILLKRRIQLMLSLPLGKLAGLSLQHEIDRIGTTKA